MPFDTDSPGVVAPPVAILGLQAGETLLAIDSRASVGTLYGLGSTGCLYQIDPADGTTSPVDSGPIVTPLLGVTYDIDFTGRGGILRVVSSTGRNFRYDVDTGATTVDPNLSYASDDSGAGLAPRAVAITSSADGYNFLIDAARDQMLGSPGVTIAESGQVRTVFPVGFDAEAPIGLENYPTGAIFLAATTPGAASSSFYTLTTFNIGSPTLVGASPPG